MAEYNRNSLSDLDEEEYAVDAIIRHPNYSESTFRI